MEQVDPLALLTSKLDEMQREVQLAHSVVEEKPEVSSQVDAKDSNFMNNFMSLFLGNRR